MKVKAMIFGKNPESLEEEKIDLIESASPVRLSFSDIQTKIDPIKETPYYVLPFVYDVSTKNMENLLYFFTDFVTRAALLHEIKVWPDSFMEEDNA